MNKKIREIKGLQVPRNLVYAVMTKVDPEGLQERGSVKEMKRPRSERVSTSANEKWTLQNTIF